MIIAFASLNLIVVGEEVVNDGCLFGGFGVRLLLLELIANFKAVSFDGAWLVFT